MKKLCATGLLGVALIAGAASPTNQTYTVGWRASGDVFLGPTNIFMQPDGYVVYMTTNPALPFALWTQVTNIPTVQVIASSPNYVAVTNVVVSVAMQPPVFATAVYTNAWGASTPLFSVGGIQGWPNSPPVATSILPWP